MGVLTEHLSRLRNEILALRSARQGLAHALKRETEERRADVSQMLANFSRSFDAVARKINADRLGSLSDLKRMVNRLQAEVHTDLSGVHQAWLALSAPSLGVVEELASQPSEEAGAYPEERPTLGVVEELASQPSEEAGAYPEERPSATGGQPPLVHGGGEKPARKKRKH